MREKDFQTALLQYAHLRGWKTAHFGNTVKLIRDRSNATYKAIPDRGASGFPDLVLVRNTGSTSRLIFAELKATKGTTSAAQKAWLEELELIATCAYKYVQVFTWKPEDWAQIEEVLK